MSGRYKLLFSFWQNRKKSYLQFATSFTKKIHSLTSSAAPLCRLNLCRNTERFGCWCLDEWSPPSPGHHWWITTVSERWSDALWTRLSTWMIKTTNKTKNGERKNFMKISQPIKQLYTVTCANRRTINTTWLYMWSKQTHWMGSGPTVHSSSRALLSA